VLQLLGLGCWDPQPLAVVVSVSPRALGVEILNPWQQQASATALGNPSNNQVPHFSLLWFFACFCFSLALLSLSLSLYFHYPLLSLLPIAFTLAAIITVTAAGSADAFASATSVTVMSLPLPLLCCCLCRWHYHHRNGSCLCWVHWLLQGGSCCHSAATSFFSSCHQLSQLIMKIKSRQEGRHRCSHL
jgi:hypothetical protein